MLLLFSGLWQKAAGYVIMVGAVIGALLVAYGRGRRAMREEVQRRVLGRDLENRRLGEVVRGNVAGGDPADGLRKWQRGGG